MDNIKSDFETAIGNYENAYVNKSMNPQSSEFASAYSRCVTNIEKSISDMTKLNQEYLSIISAKQTKNEQLKQTLETEKIKYQQFSEAMKESSQTEKGSETQNNDSTNIYNSVFYSNFRMFVGCVVIMSYTYYLSNK